jgi:hypothetical protein
MSNKPFSDPLGRMADEFTRSCIGWASHGAIVAERRSWLPERPTSG